MICLKTILTILAKTSFLGVVYDSSTGKNLILELENAIRVGRAQLSAGMQEVLQTS
jgi:hypothetical protein